MLASIAVPLLIVGALGAAFASARTDPLILRRPYNNRYSDASAARDESAV